MKNIPLPPPDNTLLAAYKNLTTEIDRRIGDLIRQRYSTFLQCRPGCSGCCIAFSVLPLEAAILQEELLRKKKPAMRQSQDNCCALLQENGLCAFYDRRPILCRTQGMALAYLNEVSQAIEVSACPYNFSEAYLFKEDDLLYMDDINDRLAALNLKYCRQAGLQPDCRIALSDIPGSLE
jgi:Fe-S-cluster containining protein